MVYWFRRPPYLRWTAAILVILLAAWLDLRPDSTELRPYATVDLAAGSPVDESMVEWRPVPAGLLPPVDQLEGIVVGPVAAGEPLLPSIVSIQRVPPPDGWWTLEVRLPAGAFPGQSVRLVVLSSATDGAPRGVSGVVIAPGPASDPLTFEDLPGLVAVPAEVATITAAAVAGGRVSVILGN